MPEAIDTQDNERAVGRPQREEQNLSVGTFELEVMLNLVRNFVLEADGFNRVVAPLLEAVGGSLSQQQTELNNLIGGFAQISQEVSKVNARMSRVVQVLDGDISSTADNSSFQTKERIAKE